MYNRYTCRCKEYCRTEPKHEPGRRDKRGCDPPLLPPRQAQSKTPESKGLGSLIKPILDFLPKDLDFGDIMLFGILFLLFLKNGDEECLIILAVMLFMN
jgi:hypothetical protein